MSNIETSGAVGRYTGAVELGTSAVEVPAEQVVAAETQNQEQAPIDFEKRYKDAQAELTKLQQEKAAREKAPDAKPEEGATEEPLKEEGAEEEGDKPTEGEGTEGDQEQDIEAEVAAKVDVAKFESEFTEKGELSAESYAELEGKGFSKDDVDDFIAFRQERNQRFVSAISEEVGGDESWTSVQEWAKENMPEADRDAFNKGMADAAKTRDAAAAKLLAAGVMQRYQEANGFGSQRSATSGAANEGGSEGGGYASKPEWQADMRSDAYRNNPAERARVDAKLARSGWYKAQNGL